MLKAVLNGVLEKICGIKYFTSIGKVQHWFKDKLKTNPEEFKIRIHYTFDTPEETYEFENYMIKRLYRKGNWLNMMAI